jgi:hypothetical protein
VPFKPLFKCYDVHLIICIHGHNIANTYICAFLNSDTGGSLYCGVRDDGIITGVILTREQRDSLRLNLDGHIARYQVCTLTHSITYLVLLIRFPVCE